MPRFLTLLLVTHFRSSLWACMAPLCLLALTAWAEPPAYPPPTACEPSLAELQAAAVRYAGLEPERVRSWLHRLRVAPLLPRLHAQGSRGGIGIQVLDALYPSTTGWRVAVDATWSLDELIFRSAELQVAQTAMRMHHERQQLLALVTRTYFDRLRLLRGPSVSNNPQDELEKQLRLAELTATLNSLTVCSLRDQLVSAPTFSKKIGVTPTLFFPSNFQLLWQKSRELFCKLLKCRANEERLKIK